LNPICCRASNALDAVLWQRSRAHAFTMRNGANRFVTSIFVGVCVGLVLSIGSLHLAKVQRDAVAAIDIAQTQVANAVSTLSLHGLMFKSGTAAHPCTITS
jgi:hypothetical protein